MSKTNSTTKVIVEGAMLIALATVFSYFPKIGFTWLYGGSITLEMIPIALMSYRNGTKWGCITGFTHGLLQMILGFSNVMYCATLIAQIGCILLDYLLAFSALGLAAFFAGMLKEKKFAGYIFGAVMVGLLRFICSFLSGWLLWGSYAPEGTAPAVYSLVYNGSYMLPNTIIMVVVFAVIAKTAPVLLNANKLNKED
ncbi:MAG: energy-coupled thiamine transporter ThiT [Lachnospiraceae bacterium]|nr:energy-coupled thiamine transporter ThiT [Candidatus Colinaster scatohippi]